MHKNIYKKYRCLQLSWIIVFTLFAQLSFAWGVTGHRVIAEIAQHHLTSKASRELKNLIGKSSLAYWANWGDFIKSDSSWRYANKWHYVDLPAHMEKDAFINSLKTLPGENLYTQIQAMEAQLKDKSLSPAQRQVALRFLIHLVGDLQQPLHVGREEDQGGNKIMVTWFDKQVTLHALWDETLVDFQQWSYTEYASILDIADKDQEELWQNSTLEDWFYESHVLSDKIYDRTVPNTKLSYNYNFIFVQDLNDQLLKGGLRLAKILNEILR